MPGPDQERVVPGTPLHPAGSDAEPSVAVLADPRHQVGFCTCRENYTLGGLKLTDCMDIIYS